MRITFSFASLSLVLLAACSGKAQHGFQGYVEGDFVYLASSQPGRLERLNVARGDQVAAGAPLFGLESVQERAAQQQAQHQLEVAAAQLQDLKSGKRPAEVAVISAQLISAEVQARKSGAQRRRDEAQYRAGGISQEQLEATRAEDDADSAKVRELQHQVEVARLPGREQQLRAQTEQVEAARAALAEANWKLDEKAIAAPQAGLVYDTLYREGEWINAGSPVVRMLPPQNIKVRFFVPETVVGSLAPGRTVSVACDGCAAEVPAAISYISAESEYTPPVIYSNETRVKLTYMIEARPSPQDAPKLHPGQPLTVRLQ
ncbi:MAG TPA: HlyD family efflux transporter periplasmic adaptor subunit [Steroidobacteraceae bacterium]|jgi:HlyD family secretion protein|nr:HlyD family efflux transporter periplasmic adaptor subunit [Steroidobacteraceae bacterium]